MTDDPHLGQNLDIGQQFDCGLGNRGMYEMSHCLSTKLIFLQQPFSTLNRHVLVRDGEDPRIAVLYSVSYIFLGGLEERELLECRYCNYMFEPSSIRGF
jgi:hypothetical protein